MNGSNFINIINEALTPFMVELGFTSDPPSISGRFFRASYTGRVNAVIVTYEPGDQFFEVMFPTVSEGELSSLDDPQSTPRLADLNSKYMSMITHEERIKVDHAVKLARASDSEELTLLKKIKEVRLVLLWHLRYLNAPLG